MTLPNKRLAGMLMAVVLLLLVPLIAMQFTNQVKWTAADFAVAAFLLTGTVLVSEFILRKIRKPLYRLLLLAVVLLLLALVWLELAVGVFGTRVAGT